MKKALVEDMDVKIKRSSSVMDDSQPSVQDLEAVEEEYVKEEYNKDITYTEYTGYIDSFRLFLREIGRYPLLSADEEVAYASKVKNAREFDMSQFDDTDMTDEEKQAEFDKIKLEGEQAKRVLIDHNLRLVVNIAKHYAKTSHSYDLSDLVQEGSLGLIKAIDYFDPDKGFKLSTYATWWIRQTITRYIANYAKTIRLPVHLLDKIHKYKRFVSMYTLEHGGVAPTDEEVSAYLGIDQASFKQFLSYTNDTVSLDQKINNAEGDDDTVLGDFVLDTKTNVERDIDATLLKADIEEALSTLNDREADVIRYRFGLVDGRLWTLEEVGQLYNVTRERIRQIEAKALRKLRAPSRSRKLVAYTSRGSRV